MIPLRTADILTRRDAERLVGELAALRAAIETLTDRLAEQRPDVHIHEAPGERLALSREEAAKAVGVSPDLIDVAIRAGLPHRRLNKRVLIPVRELRAWLAGDTDSVLPGLATGQVAAVATSRRKGVK